MKKVKLNIYVEEQLYEKIKRLAADDRRSISALCAYILEKEVNQNDDKSL